jgi:hypothetical protein
MVHLQATTHPPQMCCPSFNVLVFNSMTGLKIEWTMIITQIFMSRCQIDSRDSLYSRSEEQEAVSNIRKPLCPLEDL